MLHLHFFPWGSPNSGSQCWPSDLSFATLLSGVLSSLGVLNSFYTPNVCLIPPLNSSLLQPPTYLTSLVGYFIGLSLNISQTKLLIPPSLHTHSTPSLSQYTTICPYSHPVQAPGSLSPWTHFLTVHVENPTGANFKINPESEGLTISFSIPRSNISPMDYYNCSKLVQASPLASVTWAILDIGTGVISLRGNSIISVSCSQPDGPRLPLSKSYTSSLTWLSAVPLATSSTPVHPHHWCPPYSSNMLSRCPLQGLFLWFFLLDTLPSDSLMAPFLLSLRSLLKYHYITETHSWALKKELPPPTSPGNFFSLTLLYCSS